MNKIILNILIAAWLVSSPAWSKEIMFSSPNTQTRLVEVYVSQGCSSCPPAQDWINGFVDSPELWKTIVPVVFHVDYWDYLGWKDPFASQEFTKRQRQYKTAGHIDSVYTPGFVVNGREWRGWFEGKPFQSNTAKAGRLSGRVESWQLEAHYDGKTEPLLLNVAILGFDLQTHVTRGENRSRDLREHFIVLSHDTYPSENGRWSVPLPKRSLRLEDRLGLAIWVNRPGELTPLQATGGWLKK